MDTYSASAVDDAIFANTLASKGTILIAFGLICVLAVVHRIVTDPLRKIPGPFLARFSNAPYSYWLASGRQPQYMIELHKRYGHVVRIAPNELSFNRAASWKDVYGHRQGHQPFIKSAFYEGFSFSEQTNSIVSARDVREHAAQRKRLSHAFSDRALKSQEHLVAEMVDELIEQLDSKATGPEGADMVLWFNLVTFDIIGSLAFGESFGGLKSTEYHSWVKLVVGAQKTGMLVDIMTRFPLLAWVFQRCMPGTVANIVRETRLHKAHTTNIVKKRLATKTDRPDFFTHILEHRDSQGMSEAMLTANASDFVTAGSETTATTLSCAIYYLLKRPSAMKKLQEEVRSTFESYDKIDAANVSKLRYLRAVELEAMRIYPAVPLGLPRVVPPGGDTVDGVLLPEGVIVSTHPVAAAHDPKNFENPLEFLPERWVGVNDVDDLDAIQPFSLGPRGCIGRNLAKIELDTILAKLLWTFDLELLNQDLDWMRDSRMAILWQKPELRVRLRRRGDIVSKQSVKER